eukprot:786249-Pelagomonas_calceolata.AAC.3
MGALSVASGFASTVPPKPPRDRRLCACACASSWHWTCPPLRAFQQEASEPTGNKPCPQHDDELVLAFKNLLLCNARKI